MDDLEKICKKGEIKVEDFVEFAAGRREYRTHLLDKGDYVVLTHFNRRDILLLERIAELDFPEKGDFVTVNGTIGPIGGNIFIKINKGGFARYLLIAGDRLNEVNCPVYDLICQKYTTSLLTGGQSPNPFL